MVAGAGSGPGAGDAGGAGVPPVTLGDGTATWEAVTPRSGRTGRPAVAATMKSCQMRAGTLPPTTWAKPSRFAIGVSAPG
jgi:hypothetical protein